MAVFVFEVAGIVDKSVFVAIELGIVFVGVGMIVVARVSELVVGGVGLVWRHL